MVSVGYILRPITHSERENVLVASGTLEVKQMWARKPIKLILFGYT